MTDRTAAAKNEEIGAAALCRPHTRHLSGDRIKCRLTTA